MVDDPITAGFMPADQFMMARGIKRDTFWRWRRNGLPWRRFGKQIFIDIEGAKQWFANDMRPPAKKLRRRKVPS